MVKSSGVRREFVIFLSICVLGLWGVFAADPLGLGAATHIRHDSEQIILLSIEHAEQVIGHLPPGPLLTDKDGAVEPYVSQFGLQGIFLVAAHQLFMPDQPARQIMRWGGVVNALLLAAVLSVFAWCVAVERGLVAGVLLASMLGLSNWLTAFAINVYWDTFLFFIPFVGSWVCFQFFSFDRALRYAMAVTAIGVLVKSLCGYEYVSNIAGASAVPLIYFGLQQGRSLKSLVKPVLLLAGAAVAGFGLAILLQLAQLSSISEKGGIEGFEERIAFRTMEPGEGMSDTYDKAVISGLHRIHAPEWAVRAIEPVLPPLRPVMRYFRYLAKPAIAPLGVARFSLPLGLFVFGSVCFLLLWPTKRWRGVVENHKPIAGALLLSLLISHSWVVLANGHMTHLHLNTIIFYIPFLLVVWLTIAAWLAPPLERVWMRATGRSRLV